MQEAFRPWAVLAVKSPRRAKTRLDHKLSPEARRELAGHMFQRVLSACTGCVGLAGTLVATDGDDIGAMSLRRGASVLRDSASAARGLSGVIDAALADVVARGATHALVLMADLPRVEPRDVSELIAILRSHDMLVVPDMRRCGTGALGMKLDLGMHACFGHADSLMRHVREGRRVGARCRVIHNPRIAMDIDTFDDLSKLQSVAGCGPWLSESTGYGPHLLPHGAMR